MLINWTHINTIMSFHYIYNRLQVETSIKCQYFCMLTTLWIQLGFFSSFESCYDFICFDARNHLEWKHFDLISTLTVHFSCSDTFAIINLHLTIQFNYRNKIVCARYERSKRIFDLCDFHNSMVECFTPDWIGLPINFWRLKVQQNEHKQHCLLNESNQIKSDRVNHPELVFEQCDQLMPLDVNFNLVKSSI